IKGLGGKTTILLSSHVLSEVSLTCQRVVIIDKGKIIAEDTAEELSQRLQGATQILARVAGPRSEILTIFRALAEVREVRVQDNGTGEQEGLTFIVSSPDHAIAREIAQTVVNHGWDLYELRPITLGLEELFVRLTTDQERQAA